ncbi:MAG: hypothetical protein AVDCRST_MAG34-355 [uncultured Nocardioidaceae bacterium]|uniref:Uncharacterized protein n=1 Tax=uncultured Nocardioidaceae bacterium TaxID=253824 RepID=A0A6J4LAN8_9ACTN|nr:MAG: hypothetical protein AVDCRST_MAG34-355 [uncultured Nocardioidaceae bacterium]
MKAVIAGVLVLFLGFWMVQAPNSLAQFAQDGGAWLWDLTATIFSASIDFLSALFG